ncbi:DEAD/DEAH box helicase [Zhihengliuella flava]|uniref:Superfamily II DNA/RNA helicase n=1 Tax=Zhihengliuella flava TaxID=1285193 RepID=A0A931DCF0_9MICC|nr:DEAD/DEAH box helicase [Zhihengliuella flava]MBG6084210.1 superfamily II DNA/RNA helicase [Zhihengliuella flava]
MTTFSSLGVPEFLTRVLSAQGMTQAFPIQEATLPSTLSGRDVLGRGQTGSGKTLAFSLPLVARLVADPRPRKARFPRALIMAPTRELATQISRTVIPLADAAGLRTSVVFGGVSQKRQEQELNAGVDILIACPGRLDDLMGQKIVDLSRVEISILDEADHMADMGFLPVVRRILDRVPSGIQHMLFSATLDNGVDKLVTRYLADPITHSVDAPQAAVNTMEHRVFLVDPEDKKELVRELAAGTGRRIMFMRTKHHAKKMALWLSKAGVPAVDLHGNLSQNARDRNLAAFSDGSAKVLVATDVAARGVHVDGVELVVHIDPPAEHKAYLHRSGRTARAGSDGVVVTVATTEQRRDVTQLLKAAGIKVPFEPVTPTSDVVAEVRGPQAAPVPYVAPVRQQPSQPKKARPSQGRGAQAGGPSSGEQSTSRSRSRRGGRGRGSAVQSTDREVRQSGQRTADAAASQSRAEGRGSARGGEGGRPRAGAGRASGAGRRRSRNRSR